MKHGHDQNAEFYHDKFLMGQNKQDKKILIDITKKKEEKIAKKLEDTHNELYECFEELKNYSDKECVYIFDKCSYEKFYKYMKNFL